MLSTRHLVACGNIRGFPLRSRESAALRIINHAAEKEYSGKTKGKTVVATKCIEAEAFVELTSVSIQRERKSAIPSA
jgi:hypothetical protein